MISRKLKYFCNELPLERPRHRWEDCIRMDLKEIDVNIRNSIDSAQDRDYWRALVNANTASKLQIL